MIRRSKIRQDRRRATIHIHGGGNAEVPTTSAPIRATPWHVWVVAILTLFWNGSGAVTIVMAQMGSRLDMAPNEVAYYANQPLGIVLATDLAIGFPIAAGVALLLRRRSAVWLFALALAALAVTNTYDVAAGTSLALRDPGWRTLTIVLVILAVLQLAYAWSMKTRGVLT
jgi:hypothetical protein